MKKRFGMGYVSDSTSYEGGSSMAGMVIRYDHTIMTISPSERRCRSAALRPSVPAPVRTTAPQTPPMASALA